MTALCTQLMSQFTNCNAHWEHLLFSPRLSLLDSRMMMSQNMEETSSWNLSLIRAAFICFWVNDVSYVMPNDRSAQNCARTQCI